MLLWYDMVNTCGAGLFQDDTGSEGGRDVFVMVFALLVNLVKVASSKIHSSKDEPMARDTASKLFAFELLLYFLEYWSDEQEVVRSIAPAMAPSQLIHNFGYCIRRVVAPCLLANTRASLEDPNSFVA
jgi:hypothetical protein